MVISLAVAEAHRQSSAISGSAVMAAGLASTIAAMITSRFGVAGTLVGTALAAMLVTGLSAILRAYLESASNKMRRARTGFQKKGSFRPAGGGNVLQRADRMGDALGWFSLMPGFKRRALFIKILLGAVAAFIISMILVTVVEAGIGNSLSCGLWANCPQGATPGVHIGSNSGNGAGFSVTLDKSGTNKSATQQPYQQSGSNSASPSNVQSAAPSNGSQNNSAAPSNVQSAAPSNGSSAAPSNVQSAPPAGGQQSAPPAGGQVPSNQQSVPSGQGVQQVPGQQGAAPAAGSQQ